MSHQKYLNKKNYYKKYFEEIIKFEGIKCQT